MAQEKEFDVYGVGNALVDILTFVDDSFVEGLNFPKGSMNLVDTAKRTEILNGLAETETKMSAGGSAANSMVAVAQSGGNGIFFAKVADDEKGKFFAEDLEASGIVYRTPQGSAEKDPTGTSIILTTPDAERTMCTHLGISIALNEAEVNEEDVAKCKMCYVEGYLWSGPDTKAAASKAMDVTKASGGKVSFTFSDLFLVELFADEFKQLISEKCDVIFCNADEAKNFMGNANLDESAAEIGKMVELAFITDGKDGALVVENGNISRVEGIKVNAIDTVGAGDAFAGGVLYGLTNGLSPVDAAKWGNYLASEVVQVQGPRLAKGALKSVNEIINA